MEKKKQPTTLVVYDNKFEEFCRKAKSGQFDDIDLYGHEVFSGYGEMPSPEAKRIFCEFGPRPVKFPDEPRTTGSHVHLN